MALIPRHPKYKLVTVKEHEFEVKGSSSYSVLFDKYAKGAIIGFTLTQPDGKIKAKKI